MKTWAKRFYKRAFNRYYLLTWGKWNRREKTNKVDDDTIHGFKQDMDCLDKWLNDLFIEVPVEQLKEPMQWDI